MVPSFRVKKPCVVFVLTIAIGITPNVTVARTYDENLNLLRQTLSRTYDKVIIPMQSFDKPLEVMYSAMIMGADMSDDAQSMHASYWALAVWVDYRLRWEPNDYDGLNFTYFLASEIWVPDVAGFNQNSEDVLATHMDNYKEWFVGVSYDGHCHFIIPVSASFDCYTKDFSSWPKDEHYCVQYFSSWAFPETSFDLKMLDSPSGNSTVIEASPDVLGAANTKWSVWPKISVHRYLVEFGGFIVATGNFTFLEYGMWLSRNWDSVYSATLLTPTLVALLLTLINFYYAESDPFAGKLASLFIMGFSLAICFLNEGDVPFSGSEPKIFRLLMANQVLQVVHLLLDYTLTIVRRSSIQVSPVIVNILTNDYLQKALLLSIQCPEENEPFPPSSAGSAGANERSHEGGAQANTGSVNAFTSGGRDGDEERIRRQFTKKLLAQVLHRAFFISFVIIDVTLLATLWPAAPNNHQA